MLIFLIHECNIFIHLFTLCFLSLVLYDFQHMAYNIFVRLTPKILIFFWADCRKPSCILNFPCISVNKGSVCNSGDPGLIPGSGRSPGEGNGNPLQYSCLENLMDRGAWQATVHGVTRVGHDLVIKLYTSCMLKNDYIKWRREEEHSRQRKKNMQRIKGLRKLEYVVGYRER